MSTNTDILIIGGGMSGIGLAAQLRRNCPAPTTFEIYEKAADIGGTWAVNTYGLRRRRAEPLLLVLVRTQSQLEPQVHHAGRDSGLLPPRGGTVWPAQAHAAAVRGRARGLGRAEDDLDRHDQGSGGQEDVSEDVQGAGVGGGRAECAQEMRHSRE